MKGHIWSYMRQASVSYYLPIKKLEPGIKEYSDAKDDIDG